MLTIAEQCADDMKSARIARLDDHEVPLTAHCVGHEALAHATLGEECWEAVGEANRSALLAWRLLGGQSLRRPSGCLLYNAIEAEHEYITNLVTVGHQVEMPVGILDIIGI